MARFDAANDGARAPAPAESRAAEALLTAIGPFARLVAHALLDELRGGDTIAQHGSPLGSRRHRAAVTRRIAEFSARQRSERDAWIIGREYLLSREALEEELAHASRGGPSVQKTKSAETNAFLRDLATELRVVK